MEISVIGVLEDQDILLDVAALALSQIDHPQSDVNEYLALLEAIEDRLCEEGRDVSRASEQAIVLTEVLNLEYGFVGDFEGYDAPVNADFMRVLDRRRGLPISLAILYVAMARRTGWVAHVLNGPDHVLVQIGDKNPVIIDPFDGGRHVDVERFMALYRKQLVDAGLERGVRLAQMTNREILARLLFNQAVRAEDDNDSLRAMAVYDRITRVAPKTLDAWHYLARLQVASGDIDAARSSLMAMSELTRDKGVRSQIMDAVKTLSDTRSAKP